MKILVSYFSASGETKKVARELAELYSADIEEIVPTSLYTAADLNWRDRKSRSTLEMTDENAKPEIKEPQHDLTSYDVIFVGFPIWWGVEPRAVDTYLDKFALSGKKIIPFATSGGSPIKEATKHLKRLYKEAIISDGILLNFGVDKKSIDKLLSE